MCRIEGIQAYIKERKIVIHTFVLFLALTSVPNLAQAQVQEKCTVIAQKMFKAPLADFLSIIKQYASSKNENTIPPKSVRRAEIVGNGKRVFVNFWIVEESLDNHRDFETYAKKRLNKSHSFWGWAFSSKGTEPGILGHTRRSWGFTKSEKLYRRHAETILGTLAKAYARAEDGEQIHVITPTIRGVKSFGFSGFLDKFEERTKTTTAAIERIESTRMFDKEPYFFSKLTNVEPTFRYRADRAAILKSLASLGLRVVHPDKFPLVETVGFAHIVDHMGLLAGVPFFNELRRKNQLRFILAVDHENSHKSVLGFVNFETEADRVDLYFVGASDEVQKMLDRHITSGLTLSRMLSTSAHSITINQIAEREARLVRYLRKSSGKIILDGEREDFFTEFGSAE